MLLLNQFLAGLLTSIIPIRWVLILPTLHYWHPQICSPPSIPDLNKYIISMSRSPFSIQCTLIRGGIVIQPGLKYKLFITPWCILAIFSVCSTNFNYCRFQLLCTVVNFVHYYKFQLLHAFFHVIIDQFDFFCELVKLAIIAVFCKIPCRKWILKHGMNPAIFF